MPRVAPSIPFVLNAPPPDSAHHALVPDERSSLARDPSFPEKLRTGGKEKIGCGNPEKSKQALVRGKISGKKKNGGA
ncbi:hypothetical protein GUJ93_ZPchr0001g31367 [Zizania palustris]|uniref:Uncharacterized protein n=1 Tax=Zizania palustris TaxID=103762 RepID=A0A8J5V7N5_ZIZPA|nr:hypothetical protein GUJ93_ZPchr0001g31367 [Zizania palustris]